MSKDYCKADSEERVLFFHINISKKAGIVSRIIVMKKQCTFF